MLSNLKV